MGLLNTLEQNGKRHKSFIFTTIVLTVVWCFISGACSKKEKWEPEIAVSAAKFNVDPGFLLNIQDKVVACIAALRDDSIRNSQVYDAVTNGLSDATKARYPNDCQQQINNYIPKYITGNLQPGDALSLVIYVSERLENESSSELLNLFYYALLSRLPNILKEPVEDSLYHKVISVKERVGFELATLIDSTSDNLLSMSARLIVNNKLKPSGTYQVSFLQDGDIIDRLLPDGSEKMPKGKSIQTFMFDRQRIETVSNTTDFWLELKSDTLRLTLDDLQSFHLQTVSITVGLRLKLNMNGKLSED
ncbi:MAG: hypothetical protein LBK47_00090 [Prevotellaceae bacterium]|jgi:hypothetical protein|nr:hypothetical protein [Prevotellaceae bacterium]